MRYFLIAGEASADLHAARLIEGLRAADSKAVFAFVGGDLMAKAAGVAPIVHYREIAFMGILPVLLHLATIRRAGKRVQQAMLDFVPDVLIPIDFAGFNFEYILPFAHKHLACPIHYYIAPKLWAWKPWRIKTLRRYVDLLLCILPFEQEYFSSRGVRSIYVGNPCVDATLEACSFPRERKRQIALLAGSRRQELSSNLGVMLQSTAAYRSRYHIVLAGAPGLEAADYHAYLKDYPWVELRFDSTYSILQESRVALVTSGTATLETALLATPEIVLYRMGGQRIARWFFRKFFTVPYISLVNLILNKEAVPELIGAEVCPESIQKLLDGLLADTQERTQQLEDMQTLRGILGTQRTGVLAANTIIEHLQTLH